MEARGPLRNRPSAVVVGAGIAGLATALALSRAGWTATVLERAPGPRGGAYVLGLTGNGYDAAERLGLLDRLRSLESPWCEAQHVDQCGRVLARMSVRTQQALVGDRVISILRGDLETVLREALEARVPIRYGAAVGAIGHRSDGRMIATASDGTSIEADLVIGADGLHSAVRELTFGPETRFRRDLGAAVISFPLADPPESLAGRTTFLTTVGRGVGVYPQRDGRLAVFFTFATDRLADDLAAGAVPTLRRVFGDLGWVWPEVLARSAAAGPAYFDSISQVRLDGWSTNRVVLVGDAAWAVGLLAGYGASLALLGADSLAAAVTEDPVLPSALRTWERRLRPTVRWKQRQGRWSAGFFLPSNRVLLAVRGLAVRLGTLGRH